MLNIILQIICLVIGTPMCSYDLEKIRREKERAFECRIESKVKQNPERYIELQFMKGLINNPSQYTDSDIEFEEMKEVLDIISQLEDGQLELSCSKFNSEELIEKLLQRLTDRTTQHLLERDFSQADIQSLLNHVKGDYLISKYMANTDYKTIKAKSKALLDVLSKHKLTKQYELVKLISHEAIQGLTLSQKQRIYSNNKTFQLPLNHYYVQDVKRDTYFWKFKVYFYESNSFLNWYGGMLINIIFKSSRGFKNICCSGDGHVPTLSGKISKLVRENYKSFEELDNDGFFSNRIQKVFLFFQNRILNQLIYQLLIVNILLRLIYIFQSLILSIFLLFLFIPWMLGLPFALIRLFTIIFIKDYTLHQASQHNYPINFPIFSILLSFLIKGIFQILICPFLILGYVWHIMLNIIRCLLLILRRIVDYFTFCILMCNGRVPRRDTFSAKKIRQKQIVFRRDDDGILLRKSEQMKKSERILKIGHQYTFEQVKEMIDCEAERLLTEYYINFQKQKLNLLEKENNDRMKEFVENSPFNFDNNRISQQMKDLINAASDNLQFSFQQKQSRLLSQIPPPINHNFTYSYSDALSLFLQVQQYLQQKYTPYSAYTWILWQHYKLQQYDYQTLTQNILQQIFGVHHYSLIFPHILMGDQQIQSNQKLLIKQINQYFQNNYNFTHFHNNSTIFSLSLSLQRIFNKQALNKGFLSILPSDWLLVNISNLKGVGQQEQFQKQQLQLQKQKIKQEQEQEQKQQLQLQKQKIKQEQEQQQQQQQQQQKQEQQQQQ